MTTGLNSNGRIVKEGIFRSVSSPGVIKLTDFHLKWLSNDTSFITILQLNDSIEWKGDST